MGTVHAGRWTRRRRLLSTVLTACCVGALAVGTATASATIDLNCSGTVTIKFTPPLNGPATTLSADNGQVSGCTSPNGTQPGVTSGTLTASGGMASGCFPIFSATATASFVWNDGSTSTASAALSTNPFVPPILSITVTAGRMAGDSILAVPVFVPHGLGCGLGGTSSLDTLLLALPFVPPL